MEVLPLNSLVGSKKLLAQVCSHEQKKKKKKKRRSSQEGRYRPEMLRNEGEKLKMEKSDALFLLLRFSLQANQKTSHVYHFFTCQ